MRVILYQHVLNSELLNKAADICNLGGLQLKDIDGVLNDEEPSFCVFFDDAHISTKSMFHSFGVYYPVIGRCSIISTPDIYINPALPDITTNLQSAHYHSLKGNNAGFLPLSSIPLDSTINHCWWHTKFVTSSKAYTVFEERTARNWYPSLWSDLKQGNRILEAEPLHAMSVTSAIQEIQPMLGQTAHEDLVVAPYNVCTESFLLACDVLGIDFCIAKRVIHVPTRKTLDVYRINIDYDLNEVISLLL